jgi:hypothetical protein
MNAVSYGLYTSVIRNYGLVVIWSLSRDMLTPDTMEGVLTFATSAMSVHDDVFTTLKIEDFDDEFPTTMTTTHSSREPDFGPHHPLPPAVPRQPQHLLTQKSSVKRLNKPPHKTHVVQQRNNGTDPAQPHTAVLEIPSNVPSTASDVLNRHARLKLERVDRDAGRSRTQVAAAGECVQWGKVVWCEKAAFFTIIDH